MTAAAGPVTAPEGPVTAADQLPAAGGPVTATATERPPVDLLALTARLVDVRSESHAEQELTDLLEAELSRHAPWLALDRVGCNLVARTTLGRDQRLVVAGHTDTVPVNGNLPSRQEGDVLWGCGTSDMKSGLAVMLALASSVPEPAVDVTWVFYEAEEVDARFNGLRRLFEERPDLLEGDVALLGEPTDGVIEAGCQGTMRMRIVLRGARAHTARPWMGRNAIHRVGGLLGDLDRYQERRPVIDGCEYREAVQAVRIEGGVAGNVVPDEVVLLVNHRFAPDRTPAQAEAHLRELCAPWVEDGDVVEVVGCGRRRRAVTRPPAARRAGGAQRPDRPRQARLDRRGSVRRARHPGRQLRSRRRHPRPHRGRARRPRADRAHLPRAGRPPRARARAVP